MIRVDSHQHYWQLDRFDYSWIQADNTALHQDRMPDDLHLQMQVAGIDRAVLVQAASTVDEIPWLLHLCDEHPYIAAVVGGIDLASHNADVALTGFSRHPCFKGVRLQLQVAVRHPRGLVNGLNALQRHNLTCDMLLSNHFLPQAIELITSHPGVTFILNHLAGVRATLGGEAVFASSLEPLKHLPNAVMKLSGYLSSTNVPVTAMAQTLAPYIEVAIDTLGTQRLMYGSDWPVCTQAGSYLDTVDVMRSVMQSLGLSETEKADIWGGTAARVYQIAP
jgi:L-fuconolactonase